MRKKLPDGVAASRVVKGLLASTEADGFNGAFSIHGPCGMLTVISGDGEGWEHVSVSTPIRCPSWEEMTFVRDLFWGPEECVMQLHPPKSQFVNNHKYCLHLWKPKEQTIPQPPLRMV